VTANPNTSVTLTLTPQEAHWAACGLRRQREHLRVKYERRRAAGRGECCDWEGAMAACDRALAKLEEASHDD
jgi:hypothetical protein